jgi:hypothetical protein
MGFLARAKRTTVRPRALIIDAFQTKTGLKLSATTPVSRAADALLGWWASTVHISRQPRSTPGCS